MGHVFHHPSTNEPEAEPLWSDEYERAALGALIVNRRMGEVDLHEDDFFSPRNRAVFLAMKQLEKGGTPLDILTLKNDLMDNGGLEGVGPAVYLAEITEGVPTGKHVETYAEKVRWFANRRSVVILAQGVAEAAADTTTTDRDVEEFIEGLTRGRRTGHAELLTPMSTVLAAMPEYLAGGMVRERGLHLWWGPPGGYKTYTAIRLVLEMTQRKAGDRLFDTTGLEIVRPWRRVLWLGDEESAAEWKGRAEIVARGHGLDPPRDEVIFADASGGSMMLTTDNIPQLLSAAGDEVNAVFVDPLANLLPASERPGGDPNEHALGRVLRPMRRLTKRQGVEVFLLHHPNATGQRERGATAYRGSADVVVEVRNDSGTVALIDCKNRDAAKGRFDFRPEWSTTPGGLALRFEPADAPVESAIKGLTGTSRAMFIAVQAGAGKVTHRDLMDTAYGGGGRNDVATRTKQRAWKDLVNRGLVCEDGGVVKLLDPREDDDTEAT